MRTFHRTISRRLLCGIDNSRGRTPHTRTVPSRRGVRSRESRDGPSFTVSLVFRPGRLQIINCSTSSATSRSGSRPASITFPTSVLPNRWSRSFRIRLLHGGVAVRRSRNVAPPVAPSARWTLVGGGILSTTPLPKAIGGLVTREIWEKALNPPQISRYAEAGWKRP